MLPSCLHSLPHFHFPLLHPTAFNTSDFIPRGKKGKICYFSLFLSVCLSVCVSFSWFQGNQGNLDNTIPVNPHCKCKLQKCKNPDFWPQDVILAGNTIFEPKIYFILTLLTKSPRHMSTLPSTVPVFSQKPL